ncbi:hypothetical protein ACE1ET_01360 [Saccharicrinis sp. FJH62]|uniref:hypothetical protein n=1 Tax=Saccharicrinis sp. FJH62 TaxID=3344657 RepID=UPI0035D48B7E
METRQSESVSYFVVFSERFDNQKDFIIQNLENRFGKTVPNFSEDVEINFLDSSHFGEGYSVKITAPVMLENLLHEHFLTNSKAMAIIKIE